MNRSRLLVVIPLILLLAQVALAQPNIKSTEFQGNALVFNGEGRVVVVLDEDSDLLADRIFLFSPLVPFDDELRWNVGPVHVEFEGDYIRLSGDEIWIELGLEEAPFAIQRKGEHVLQISEGIEFVHIAFESRDKKPLDQVSTEMIEGIFNQFTPEAVDGNNRDSSVEFAKSCKSGGTASTSCSVGCGGGDSCSVSCRAGYYACCNCGFLTGAGCKCIET